MNKSKLNPKDVIKSTVYGITAGDKIAYITDKGNISFGKSLGYIDDYYLIRNGKRNYWIYKTKVEKVK